LASERLLYCLSSPREARMLSVIIPIYNEVENIPLLHAELLGVLRALDQPFEIIYVDDGSRDGSFDLLKQIATSEPEVVAIQFRRNFGQTAALAAGMEHARGDVLVFMDGDLQNDPADIPRLLERMREGPNGGYDVVSGWRFNRQDHAVRRKLPSRIANWIISQVSGVRLHDYGCTLKAYRREVLENVRLYGEMHRFIPAYAAWSGASIAELKVNHRARKFGKSKYGIGRTLKVVLDLMTLKFLNSYSTKPSYLFGGLGFACWGLGILALIWTVVERFTLATRINRNPMFTVGLILGVMGLQFLLMGLLAEMMIRIYHESQEKPTYVVRDIVAASPRARRTRLPSSPALAIVGAGTADRSSQAALLELGRQIMAMAGERETGENGH
jgi:glycosyltransferase involved in cell wall biosynthesis